MASPRPASPKGGYDLLGLEYYDAARHPTCANFRRASELYLEPRLLEFGPEALSWCEIGCGRSLAAPAISTLQHSLDNLILSDSSPSMLAHSSEWISRGATRLIADAEHLPLPDGSQDLVVASLGDAYNTINFWREAGRLLSREGVCLFTTPSFDWASSFRPGRPHTEWALFALRDGTEVMVPSIILNDEDQATLVQTAGLQVVEHSTIALSQLGSMPVSSKLLPWRGPLRPIVTGWTLKCS